MPGSDSSSEKSFNVDRSLVGINSIGRYSQSGADNVITLTEPHTFINGESVRVYGDTGQIPDGLSPNTVYYVITDKNPSKWIVYHYKYQTCKNLK